MTLQDYLSNLFGDVVMDMNYMILDQQFNFRKLIISTYLNKDVSINVSSKKNPWYCYECKGEGFWINRLTTKPMLDITIHNSDNGINTMSVFVFDTNERKCKVNIFSYFHFNGSTVLHHNIIYNIKPVWKI